MNASSQTRRCALLHHEVREAKSRVQVIRARGLVTAEIALGELEYSSVYRGPQHQDVLEEDARWLTTPYRSLHPTSSASASPPRDHRHPPSDSLPAAAESTTSNNQETRPQRECPGHAAPFQLGPSARVRGPSRSSRTLSRRSRSREGIRLWTTPHCGRQMTARTQDSGASLPAARRTSEILISPPAETCGNV